MPRCELGTLWYPLFHTPLKCPVPSDVPALLRESGESVRAPKRGPHSIPLPRQRNGSFAGSRAGARLRWSLSRSGTSTSCPASEEDQGSKGWAFRRF